MTPILVIVFGFKPTLAVGTDILHGAIFKTVGAIRHRQLGTVHARLSGWMLIGSAPFSLLGVALGTRSAQVRRRATDVMGYILGGALLFGAAGLVLKSFVSKKVVGEDDRFDMVWRDRIAAVAIGVVGGFIVGLTSVGSGTFFGLTMLFVFPLGAHKIVGTDILHAAALLYVAGFGPLHRRQRRHPRRRLAADRLDPRRADRQPLLGPGPGGVAAARARRRARDQRPEARAGPERLPRRRDRRVASPSGASLVRDTAALGCARRGRSCSGRARREQRDVKLRGRAPRCSRLCSSSRCWVGRRPRSRSRRA